MKIFVNLCENLSAKLPVSLELDKHIFHKMFREAEKFPFTDSNKERIKQTCYLHSAAISLGRSAPKRPKRWLLARRSKGEWLRMELKVNGYMARGNSAMCRSWCSLLVAIVEN